MPESPEHSTYIHSAVSLLKDEYVRVLLHLSAYGLT